MYPILFKIGGLTFYTHGVLAVVGIIIGSLIIYKLAGTDRELDRSYFFDTMVWVVLFGIIGARLTYYFLYSDQFSSFSEIIYLQDGGMVSYGGFLAGLVVFMLFLRFQQQSFAKWLDLLAVGFAFGLFFGRLGNIAAGEYAGVTTASKFNIAGYIPVTLYEGILAFILGSILFSLYKKAQRRRDGIIFLLFVFCYGLGRFIIDFWRDESVVYSNLGIGQWVSLAILLIASISLVALNRAKRKDRHAVI